MANPFDQFDPAPTAQDASVISGVAPTGDADSQQGNINPVQQVGGNPHSSNPFDQFDAPPRASMGNNATQPGYLTRIKNDLSKRNDMVNDAVGEFGVGPISLAAGVGKGVAGSVNDVLGETAKSGYDSLPSAVTTPINNAALASKDYLLNTDAGKYMAGKAGDAAGVYKNFAAQNPKTASVLESIGDIGVAAANLIPAAKGVSELAEPVGAGLSAAKDLAGSTTLGKGIAARGGDELAEAADAIKANANAKYQQHRDAGAVLSPEAGQQVVAGIQKQLGRLSPRRQGDTFSVLEDLKDRAAEGNMSLEDLDDFRQDFRDAHNDNTDFTGRTTSDGRQASRAIDALDNFVDNLGPDHLAAGSPEAVDALNAGRSQWSQYRKFDAVTNLVKQADGDPNRLKASLTRFMNKPKNTAGWSDDEIAAGWDAARSTASDKLLKTVGKFGIDLGSSTSPGNTFIPGAASLAFGAAHGAGSGAGLLAAGTAARQGAKWMARGKAENLLQTIEDNAHNTMTPPSGEKRGGAINKKKGGAVFARPKSYPALEKRV